MKTLALLLAVVALASLSTGQKTFDSELEKRITQTEALLKNYEKFLNDVEKKEVSLKARLTQNNNTITNEAVRISGFNKQEFDEFLSNKGKALEENLANAWKKTDSEAKKKSTTIKSYTNMKNLDLSETWWVARVNKDYKRSNYFNTYITLLSKLLAVIEHYDLEGMKEEVNELKSGGMTDAERLLRQEQVDVLKQEFHKLAQFAAASQFHEEEKQRTEGQSGIKQIRAKKVGAENYHSNTHSGGSFCAIHDHSNNIRTVGMGEFVGVLNGIEFRTRHNDYRLYRPSTTSGDFHSQENVPFPDVPPEVLAKNTVGEQIEEMREWFKAWQNGDNSVRNYKKYFKPVMTYAEGAWTLGKKDGSIDEPFSSDRHHIDAKSWLDLQDKVRYNAYSGSKSLLENLAHLPTKITRFEEGDPVLAQWNYRISVHPIEGDISIDMLEVRYDEASQRKSRRNREQYLHSRSARFDFEGININGTREAGAMDYNLLDSIMEQIPGKDNYKADITEQAFDGSGDDLYSANPNTPNKPLNLGYYHRAFIQKSADGTRRQDQRTFSDRVFVAHTTQGRIAPQVYGNSYGEKIERRVSFAIPVEIIWLTPLHSWNPYNIPMLEKPDGKGTDSMPYSGISSRIYYMTPTEFFSGDSEEADAADTVAGEVFVNTPNHGKKKVQSSGTRIVFPKIAGIENTVRQRYPIMPIHGEGSALFKKLNALEDAMGFDKAADIQPGTLIFVTGVSHSDQTTGHVHVFQLQESDLAELRTGEKSEIDVTTESRNGHSHNIIIRRRSGADDGDSDEFIISSCDTNSSQAGKVCWDNHSTTMTKTG